MTSFRLRSWPRLSLALLLMVLLAGCTLSPDGAPTPMPTLAASVAPFPDTFPTATAPPPVQTTNATVASVSPVASCTPNREDPPNWDYPPEPPERGSVGTGYRLSGVVRALGTCHPIVGARIVLWLANPQGVYDDASRATIVADPDGGYRFESHVPVSYDGVRPHIHMRVTAPGFRPLMTTHLYDVGQHRPIFDLVLVPEQ